MGDRENRQEKRLAETRAAYRARAGSLPGPTATPTARAPDSRDVEARWVEEHRAELRQRYAGQWIVVEGEALVAHHRVLQEAVNRANRSGVLHPFVLFIRTKRYEDAHVVV